MKMLIERGLLVALEVQELKRRKDHQFSYCYSMAEEFGFAYEFEFAYKQARNIGIVVGEALNIAYRFFTLNLHDFERGGVLEPHEFDEELYDMLTISLEGKPEDIDRKDLINV